MANVYSREGREHPKEQGSVRIEQHTARKVYGMDMDNAALELQCMHRLKT